MSISNKKLAELKLLYEKLQQFPKENLPCWPGYLCEYLHVSIWTFKSIFNYYGDITEFIGTKETQQQLLHERQSLVSKIRESQFTEEYKEKRRLNLSEKGKKQYENLSDEEKLNYRQARFLKNWSDDKENERRRKIHEAESKRSYEKIQSIVNKRKATFELKSVEDIQEMRIRQGRSLHNTLSNLSEAEKLQRNLKTGEGRKQAYKKESPEHKQQTKQKIMNTCLERYGVPWFTLTSKIKKSGRVYSKVNKAIADMLTKMKISYEQEFNLCSYSYDFKIGNYLIEIDPSATHNVDWIPFSDDSSNIISEDYHKKKTKTALENGFTCIHIFDWMNITDYLDDILNNTLYIEESDTLIYYFNIKENKLTDEKTYKSCKNKTIVKIVGDGYKICSCAK